MPDISVQATLTSPGTTAFTLNSPPAYQLEAATIEEAGTTWRKQEVSNPWVEGSYVVSAVRENIVTPVNVWVRGSTTSELQQRVLTLTTAVGKPRWTLAWALEGLGWTWTCQTSEYTIRTQREFIIAKIALVRIQVVRLPSVTYTYANGTSVTV